MKVFKPLATTMVALSFLFCSTLQAQYKRRSNERNMNQGEAISSSQMIAAYNAPARYDVEESWDSFIYGKFLYMIAYQDNMNYAISKTDVARTGPPLNGKVVNTDFDWHPGVKVGAGFNTDFDDFEVYAEWMHYISKNRGSVIRPTGGNLFPTTGVTIGSGINTATAANARTTWSLVFNSLDLMLGRNCYNGRNLTMDLVYGPSGVWIEQEFNNQYEGVNDNNGGQNTTRTFSDYSSWGIGPKAGIKSNWLLGLGFKFFGNASASLLYTRFNSKTQMINPDIVEDMAGRSGDVVTSVRMDRYSTLRPNATAELGFGWGSYFDDDNWHVELAVSYEYQLYWEQNANMVVLDDIQRGKFITDGDLSIHGGAFSLRFDF